MIIRSIAVATLSLLAALPVAAIGEQPISLIEPKKAQGGWTFGNGREFPGAQGGLEVAAEPFRDQPVLALKGDFTKGGNYVQAAISLPDVPVERLSFWINAPAGSTAIPIRLIDSTGQCHQLRLKLNDKGGWQHIDLPVDEYFRKMGTADALDVASQYENWSGAKDGAWHQPGKLFVVLCSRALGDDVKVLLSDVRLLPAPPKTSIVKTIRLDEMLLLGELGWDFNLGKEYRGAKGGLEIVRDQPVAGFNAMHLHGDFTEGGAYVGMRKSFATLNVEKMNVIRMKMRSDSVNQFALRMVDGSGQTHQRKTLPFKADGKWQDIEILPTKIAGGEHWGGANDGQWHGAVKLIELMLNTRSNKENRPEMLVADIRADVIVEATPIAASFEEKFESVDDFKTHWQTSGDVTSNKQLALARTLKTNQTETSAISKPFAVSPGTWQVAYTETTDLHSPDNSYHGAVSLELFDAAGKLLETAPVGIGYGKHDAKAVSQTVQIPATAAKARFRVELKKTYGQYRIDNLSASRLKVQPIEQVVERILLTSDATGNLFLPGDPVLFSATIETTKPLVAQQLQYSIRDYGGVEQIRPSGVPLAKQPRKNGRFTYTAEIALPASDLSVGKFYELHVAVPENASEPTSEYSGFAILPPAVTKQFKPEDVPFTIRNWDSRVPAYFHLADRLGLRMIGVWGGWKPNAPYKPHCPGIDLCNQLDAKWITGTPASQIEDDGFTKFSEESLRAGMKNFLEAYADKGLAKIAMGNEPHGTGKKVLDNVRAYRAIYETVKAFDPEIHVMGTSVEPNEEYFKAGYQNYLDSYDFHIYEHYTKVRKQMREYRALMQKYDAVKPIHSTELGLNSQGQTRLAVSREMIKKFAAFFAEGGDTVSWFTIQYPDPKGKARGQFGDSHCMFDCKYSLYNPRLDAITHYHLINAICVKKFIEEKHYDGGAQAFLFRDDKGRTLQILWLDGERQDAFVPIATDGSVRIVRLDGTEQVVQPSNGGITLSLSDDPLLLLYDDGASKLAEELAAPALSLVGQTGDIIPGDMVKLAFVGKELKRENIRVIGPPLWKIEVAKVTASQLEVNVHAPASSTAREAKIRVQLLAGDAVTGELQVPLGVIEAKR